MRSKKTTPKKQVKEKEYPFYFNFLLDPQLCQEGIYNVELPVNTKIIDVVEYTRSSMGGQFCTDTKRVYNTPTLICQRPYNLSDLEKRQFILVDVLDIDTLNDYKKKLICIGTMYRSGVITTDILKLWEIK